MAEKSKVLSPYLQDPGAETVRLQNAIDLYVRKGMKQVYVAQDAPTLARKQAKYAPFDTSADV